MTRFTESLKISLCEDKILKDTQNLKCVDRRLQNFLVLRLKSWQLGQRIEDLNSMLGDLTVKCD